MRIVDFHSHIIPHIDDGAKNTSESLELLVESKKQGVTDIVATPHFSGIKKDVDKFIKKRDAMLEILYQRIEHKNADVPRIHKGAEVSLQPGLSDFTNLKELCIENTNYILLEMPYTCWFNSIFDEINAVRTKSKLIPIIAHVERYSTKKINWDIYSRLLSMDVVLQFNTSSFCFWKHKSFANEILKSSSGLPVLLGSDCHDPKYRSTTFKKGCTKIQRKHGKVFLDKIFADSELILNNTNILDD